jgi:hypothetical protein
MTRKATIEDIIDGVVLSLTQLSGVKTEAHFWQLSDAQRQFVVNSVRTMCRRFRVPDSFEDSRILATVPGTFKRLQVMSVMDINDQLHGKAHKVVGEWHVYEKHCRKRKNVPEESFPPATLPRLDAGT